MDRIMPYVTMNGNNKSFDASKIADDGNSLFLLLLFYKRKDPIKTVFSFKFSGKNGPSQFSRIWVHIYKYNGQHPKPD